MKKIIIFGNSGSGKSTLAKKLSRSENLAHLDLDVLAWKPVMPPERKPISESKSDIIQFIASNEAWVIEGCYSDLIEIALTYSTQIIFMNLPVEACIANARNRPWEPHKYASKKEQDNNLDMLLAWIEQYAQRTDTFSQAAHTKLYEEYAGAKLMHTENV